MEAAARFRIDVASLGFVLSCTAAAAMVGWMAVAINHERACAWNESVAARWCPGASSRTEADALRARIARDPGDANAYAALALGDASQRREALIATASGLAPREPNLMLARAAIAFDRGDWDAAIPPLVELADHRDEVSVALVALASLIQKGETARLEPYVQPGARWLGRVLGYMRGAGGLSGALPLIIRGMNTGALEADTVRGYVRDMKSAGAWADAYALWLSLHGKSVPLLFNAGFDRAFEVDGFDWEVPQPGAARRAGVTIERRRAEQRGAVLDLQFTGRAIGIPIVRQYLFIAPGRYRLRGDHLGRQFRSEQGLAWVVRCGTSAAGMSGPLRDTLGLWQAFDFEFTISPACGLVASLQLETTDTAEAALGARGRVSFDAFSLERIGAR